MKPIEDETGAFFVTFTDETSRDCLWKSRTHRDLNEWRIGEIVEHDGAQFRVHRVHSAWLHHTVFVDRV